ncbi:hypothetical protein HO173_007723 [Letharia columbiana]|uniref:Carrier domain-containing protein n=1 Tax=Letharia columbiana TaxID=112416 RepID=A0A8H6L3K5_9LECA|nr:uncharacterized protein HO173_007723 [Letharia columbiana]KAF6234301.1 hypothetical protein HO173_007723 [Letharia columbiana]
MSYEDWRAGTDSKMHCSWNLHMLLPKNIAGQRGQAEYAAGNTYKDALAHYRITQRGKAVSIDLRVMVSEGFLSENEFPLHRMLDSSLYVPLKQIELFGLLDYLCDPELDTLTTQTCQTVVGIETPASLRSKGVEEALWMRTPLLRHMYQVNSDQKLSVGNSKDFIDYRGLFASAGSLSKAGSIVLQALIKRLSRSLSTSKEGIDTNKSLHSYGVDSLLAIELKTWIAEGFAAEIPIFEILGRATAAATAMTTARNSRLMQGFSK